MSYYTSVHLSVTPFATGSSHNLLSDRPHNEGDGLWTYGIFRCSVAESTGTLQVLFSKTTAIVKIEDTAMLDGIVRGVADFSHSC